MSPNVDELVDAAAGRLPAGDDTAAGVPGRAVRPRPGLVALPARFRRPGPDAQGSAAGPVPPERRRRAGRRHAQPHRLRHVRAHHRHPRHTRTEGALPAPPLHRRGDLVPALQRARAGSDVAGLSTRAERDGEEWVLNGQKVWTTLAHISSFGLLAGAHQPRRAQAQGDDRLPGRHEGTRSRGPAALPDHGRSRVQRGLLHRRPHARRGPARRRGRRVACRRHDADERAGLHRRRRHPRGGGPVAEAIESGRNAGRGTPPPMRWHCATGWSRATSAWRPSP